jgi:hypothetical protein
VTRWFFEPQQKHFSRFFFPPGANFLWKLKSMGSSLTATDETGLEAFQFFLNELGPAIINWRNAAAAA